MPQQERSTDTDQLNRQANAVEKGREQKDVSQQKANPRAWAALNQLHGARKQSGSRQKIPSGPVGGSGRKTNLARSS